MEDIWCIICRNCCVIWGTYFRGVIAFERGDKKQGFVCCYRLEVLRQKMAEGKRGLACYKIVRFMRKMSTAPSIPFDQIHPSNLYITSITLLQVSLYLSLFTNSPFRNHHTRTYHPTYSSTQQFSSLTRHAMRSKALETQRIRALARVICITLVYTSILTLQ